MRLRNPVTHERVVVKDARYIETLKAKGWQEEPRPVSKFKIPHGALHTCCLCDVTFRHGIDGFRCPHPKPEE